MSDKGKPFKVRLAEAPVDCTREERKEIHEQFKKVARWPKFYADGVPGVDEHGHDCSHGCKFFHPVKPVGADWGVCTNPDSPQAGLLTFEHVGCKEFEYDDSWDFEDG